MSVYIISYLQLASHLADEIELNLNFRGGKAELRISSDTTSIRLKQQDTQELSKKTSPSNVFTVQERTRKTKKKFFFWFKFIKFFKRVPKRD